MSNEEMIDAIERVQGALSRAESTMRQPAKYVAEAQAKADKVIEALRQRKWVGMTKEERHKISMANRPYCADIMAAHEEELRKRNT